MPFGLRKLSQYSSQLFRQRRRGDRLGKKMQSGALRRPQTVERRAEFANESGPWPGFVSEQRRLSTVRIVEAQDRSLRKDIGCARADFIRICTSILWMIWISFELGWPSFIASRQQWCGHTAQTEGRGKEERFSWISVFGLRNRRDNFFRWLKHATGKTGQRERRAHQFQERSAFNWIVPTLGVLRVLA